MIYALQPTSGGPVKIGTTENLTVRVAQPDCHYGLPLAVLATLPGGPAEERELHRRFAHLRLGRTEQFQPAPDLMAFLGRPLLVGANPRAIVVMPGRLPGPRARSTTASLAVSPSYKDWIGRFAEAERSDMSDLVDDAVVAYAKARGFEPPPKR